MRPAIATWSLLGALALASAGQWLLVQDRDGGWPLLLLAAVVALIACVVLRGEPRAPRDAAGGPTCAALWPMVAVGGQFAALWLAREHLARWPILLPWSLSLVAAVAGVAGVPVRIAWRLPDPRRVWPPVIGAVMLLAALLRFVGLEGIPRGIHGDEGEFGMIALDMARGQGPSPFGVAFLGDPALYPQLLAPFVAVFGANMTAIRLLSAIVGTATVGLFYLFVRDLGGRRAGIIAALLLAGSAVHINFSRMALNVIEAPLFACLSLWLLWRGITSRRLLWYLLAGIAGGLGCYFHFSARIVVPMLALALLWQAIVRPSAPRHTAQGVGVTALGGLLSLSPFLADTLEDPSQLSDHMNSRLIWNNWAETVASYQTTPGDWFGVARGQLHATFAALLQTPDRDTFFDFAQIPFLSAIIVPLVVVGLAALCARPRSLSSGLILSWLLTPCVFGGLVVVNAGAFHRLLIALLPAIAAGAIFIDQLITLGVRHLPTRIGPTLAGVLLLAAPLAAAQGAQAYFAPTVAPYPWAETTAQGRLIETLPPGTVAYTMGAPSLLADHGTSRFLGQQVERYDLRNPTVVLPTQATDRARAIIVNPVEREWFPLVRAYYPRARADALRWADGDTTLYLITIPAGMSAATPPGAGLEGELRGAPGGTVQHRHDAAPAFMNLRAMMSGDQYSGWWEGWLRAPERGEYELEIVTDGAVTLLLDDRPVIADATQSGDVHSVRQTFTFADRAYPLRLQGDWSRGDGYLALYWHKVDGERELIPTIAFVSAP